MAGSLGGRARRVWRLEGLDHGRERPPLSRTEREARALDAEIREIEEESRRLEWTPTSGATPATGRGCRSRST